MKIITSLSKNYKEISDLTLPYMDGDLLIKVLNLSNKVIFGTPEFNLLSKHQDTNFTYELKKAKTGDILFACDADVLLNAPIEWFEKQLGVNRLYFKLFFSLQIRVCLVKTNLLICYSLYFDE